MKAPTRSILLVFIVFLIASISVVGQVQQPLRFEIEMGDYDDAFTVINGKENGLLLFRQAGGFDKGNPIYEFRSIDKDLNSKWSHDIAIDKHYELIGYDHNRDFYYMLFKYIKGNSRDFRIIKFHVDEGSKIESTITNLVNFTVTQFEVTDQAALIGGYFNLNPVVVFYDVESKKSKVLPGIYGNKAVLQHIKINYDDSSFIVMISEKTYDKRNTIAIKSYDRYGELLNNTVLQPDTDKGLVYGRAADFDADISLMSGTYSSKRSSSYSRGIYIATVDNVGEQNIRYFNYADLENFFNYMKAKKKARIEEKIERKKVNGKKVKFNYRLLVHEIISTEDQYLMIGEAFYPKYSSSSVGSMSMYTSPRGVPDLGSGMYFAGYRYTHAVVIGFDKQGNFLWDNSFQIEDLVTYQLDQFVHAVVVEDNQVALLYLYENEIRTKIIQEDEVIEGKSFDELRLSFSDDLVHDNAYETSNLEKWYDNYFYAFGTQRIKNLKDSGVKLNRRVFYINKITYN